MKTRNAAKYARIIAVIMAPLLSGCGAGVQTLVYDKPIPENQSAVLTIPDAYTVTNFDGQQVKWASSPDGFSLFGTSAAIKLPSGRHNIAYRYYRHEAGLTTYEHYASGAVVQKRTPSRTISYDGNVDITMEPGKRYIFQGHGIVIDTDDNRNQSL